MQASYTPWDQYPGETGGDYQLFGYYRDLGLIRTVAAVVRAYAPAYSYAYTHTLSHSWAWKERAEAYDLHNARERDAAVAKLRADHAERWAQDQIEIGESQTQIVKHELASLRRRQLAGEVIRPNELARLIEVLHKNQNLATGKATERVDAGYDLSNASPEQIADLERQRDVLSRLAKGQ